MAKRGVIFVTAAVFGLGAFLSILTALWAEERRRIEGQAQFDGRAARLVAEIQRRANLSVYGLMGARGVYMASESVERHEFRAYVESRDLAQEFPGVLGFGFIQRVARADLAAFIEAERADEAPDFTVHPDGDTAELYVIKFMDPLERNQAAWGYDVGSEPSRREAVERAVRTGLPTLTPRLELIQDADHRAGFLYLVPVYTKGSDTSTEEARVAALDGLVFVPIIIDFVFSDIGLIAEGMLDFEVFDGVETHSDTRLFDFDDHLAGNTGVVDALDYRGRRFIHRESVVVGGREWTVILSSTPAFEALVWRSAALPVGGAGLAVSVVLAALVWSLAQGRAHAVGLARSMTAELAESESQFRSLVNNIPGTSYRCLFDDAWTMLYISDAIEELTGYPARDFLGPNARTFDSIIHPDDRGGLTAYIGDAVARGESFHPEYRIIHADGSLRWVREKGRAHFADSPDAAPQYLEGVIFDVTEQVQAEEDLAAERARLEAFVRHAPAAVAMFDLDVRYIAVSERWIKEYGLEGREIIGLSHYDVFPSVPDRWKGIHARCLAGAVERSESDAWRPDGWDHDQVLRWEVRPWYDGQNRIAGIMMFTQDITLDKQMEKALEERNASLRAAMDELAEARRQADAANQSKSEFLANMSHEIRTPLTAILGYTDILRDDGEADRRHEIIDTIQRAGQHLLLIINDILDLSKIEAGKMTVEVIETDLVRVLLDVDSLMRPRAQEKGVALTTALDSPLPDRILSDPTRLRQILMNLVGNAAKFTASGTIAVRAGREESAGAAILRIEIEDTGPGMTAEQAAALFSPFSQADTSMARKFGGTGLGLTISRRLAHLMGGSLKIGRTAPGAGSCFVLRLPLTPAANAETVSTLSPDAAPSRSDDGESIRLRGRILLAEDNPVNQKLISHHLRKAGAEVVLADNGREALERLEAAVRAGAPFDLLVTDMQMPEMDGFALARTLRRMGSALPIVALTAQAMASDRQDCLDAGCNDYTTKPVDKAEFLGICRRWLPEGEPA